MNIDLLKNSIKEIVEDICQQIEGNIEPSISKNEGIIKLGTISELILNLHDKAKEDGANENELNEIWNLKNECDDKLEELFLKLFH